MNLVSRSLFSLIFASILIGCQTLPATQNIDSRTTKSATNSVLEEPLVLRRQTLIVRDIDRSLALYRDAIGMEVIYDNVIKRPHKTEDRMQDIRLVFLKATDDYIGVLGLVDYEYNNPSHPMHRKKLRKEGFTPGNSVVLFNTQEMEKRWPLIADTDGVDILNGPAETSYPSYDGKGKIKVLVTRFYDPDGFLVEYNQLLSDLDLSQPGSL